MTDKQLLQVLHDSTQHSIDQARNIQNSIKRLNTLKKEQDLKQQKESLIKSLHCFIKELEELHGKATTTTNDLEKSTRDSKTPPTDAKDGEGKTESSVDRQKRLPLPEDQENMYHLKARMMPQYQSKNSALQSEVMLMGRRNDLRAQRYYRQVNYNRDTNLSAATTLHVIHLHEKKAKAAEERAEQLQAELDGLKGTNTERQSVSRSAGQNLSMPNSRVNDVLRRNEILSLENRNQQIEIQRLKKDNTDLTLKAKHSYQDRNQIMSQLSTSEMARKDLYSRFQKQKDQHDRLNRSLTRQSASWIEGRKQNEQVEEDIRWANVGHAAPHGSFDRTHMHPVTRNVDQPRHMFPVEQYAQPIKS